MREPGRSRVAAVESLNMNVIVQENPPEWRTERHFFACLGGNAKQYACGRPGRAVAADDVRNESRFPPSLRVQCVSHIPAEKRQSDLYSLLDGRGRARARGGKERGRRCRRTMSLRAAFCATNHLLQPRSSFFLIGASRAMMNACLGLSVCVMARWYAMQRRRNFRFFSHIQ